MNRLEKIFKTRFLPLHPRLFSIAVAILGDATGDASDAVQETMVKIWKSGDTMFSVKRPEAYAITVLRSTAIDILRRRHPAEALEKADNISSGELSDPDSAEFMERIIRLLPLPQQEVVRLSAFQGLSSDEIAVITNLSSGNVRQLLSRGRKKIRELYNKYVQP